MNKLIKELYLEASSDSSVDSEESLIDKFAELLIKECVSLMNKEKEDFSNLPPYEPIEYQERCQAKADAFEDAAYIIKSCLT